jgi:hypothetical protein
MYVLFRSLLFVSLVSASGSMAHAQTVENVVRDFGLIGTWSANCSRPAGSGGNIYTIYAVDADGTVTLTYDSGGQGSQTVNVILRAERRGDDRIGYLQENRSSKAQIEIEVVLRDNTIKVWTSRRTTGEVLVREGKFAAGGESPVQARCR